MKIVTSSSIIRKMRLGVGFFGLSGEGHLGVICFMFMTLYHNSWSERVIFFEVFMGLYQIAALIDLCCRIENEIK